MATALAPLPPQSATRSSHGPTVRPASTGTAPSSESASARVFHEAVPIAALPLAPLCDRRALKAAPLAEDDDSGALVRVSTQAEGEREQHGWMLRHSDGVLASPLADSDSASLLQAHLVLDVYAGLLLALAEAGHPDDGRVQVGRLAFLRRINWVGPNGSAGGRLYRQLDAVVRYLAEMQITSTAIQRFINPDADTDISGTLTFRILQAHGRVTEWRRQGTHEQNRVDAGHASDDLIVFFSSPFMRALLARDLRVSYRMSHYLGFQPGAPRALYRYVSYLATQPLHEGTIVVDLNDVLASIGSTRRDVPPAKFRQLVRGADQQLVDKGLLRCKPTYQAVDRNGRRTYQVTFRPSPPPTTELTALLRETLIAYGVWPSVAVALADGNTEWVAHVVAAVTLGMLEVGADLPRMVVDYCKHPERALDVERLPRFRPTSPAQRRTNLAGNVAMKYLDESHEASLTYLDGFGAEDRRKRREAFTAPGRPRWVVDGLMLAAARSDRQGWTLDAYLRARGARRRK